VNKSSNSISGVILGLFLALMVAGCIVKRLAAPQLTGTCDGACAHYIECKPGHAEADRSRCAQECPQVFADRDSIMGYESLACDDAVEYVDGPAKKTAGTAAPVQ
jgi:hypothetical protein